MSPLMMQIAIVTRNFDLTYSIQEYIQKKFSPLTKFINGDAPQRLISVEVSRVTKHRHGKVFEAKVNLAMKGKVIYAQGSGATAFAALDDAETDFKRELRRHKAKQQTANLRSDRQLKRLIKGRA